MSSRKRQPAQSESTPADELRELVPGTDAEIEAISEWIESVGFAVRNVSESLRHIFLSLDLPYPHAWRPLVDPLLDAAETLVQLLDRWIDSDRSLFVDCLPPDIVSGVDRRITSLKVSACKLLADVHVDATSVDAFTGAMDSFIAGCEINKTEFKKLTKVLAARRALTARENRKPAPSLEKADVSILEALAKRKRVTAFQTDLEDKVDRKTVGKRLQYLATLGYVAHPDSKKQGWIITDAGMDRLKELPAID